MKYWLNVVSRDHVLAGAAGGFTQAQHGSPAGLRRMAGGDLIVFYSPRTAETRGKPLRCFTAIGRLENSPPYQVDVSPDFQPWRRNVDFLPSTETPIEPLIPRLAVLPDKQHWGLPMRSGLIEITRADFELIAGAMGAELTE